jgi:hypothetical protein
LMRKPAVRHSSWQPTVARSSLKRKTSSEIAYGVGPKLPLTVKTP